jgi:hypothetical protein
MIVTIEITDPYLLSGITEVRNIHNKSLYEEKDKNPEDHPNYIPTNEDYIIFIVNKAAESYARQFSFTQDDIAKLEAKLSEMKGKLSAYNTK